MAAKRADAIQYLSPTEVANSLGVHDRTVRRWIAEGRLKALRPSTRVIRIDPAELDRFLGLGA